MSAYERAKLALKLEPIIAARAKENLIAAGAAYGRGMDEKPFEISRKALAPVNTQKEVAKAANVSDNTIAKVKKIEARATPEQKERLTKSDESGPQTARASLCRSLPSKAL